MLLANAVAGQGRAPEKCQGHPECYLAKLKVTFLRFQQGTERCQVKLLRGGGILVSLNGVGRKTGGWTALQPAGGACLALWHICAGRPQRRKLQDSNQTTCIHSILWICGCPPDGATDHDVLELSRIQSCLFFHLLWHCRTVSIREQEEGEEWLASC